MPTVVALVAIAAARQPLQRGPVKLQADPSRNISDVKAFSLATSRPSYARATSRETIGVAGVKDVEANCALMPLTQRRQRSVSW
jgi:hypothetical protein